MALLKVIKYGHPILRQVAQKYKHKSEIDQNFIDDLIETMKREDGVGLAATQVAVPRRLVVVTDTKELYIILNPVIAARSVKTETEVEGCLSLPGLQGRVERHLKIVVRGLDRFGEPLEITASNLLARVFQHEIDHLNGVMYIDRAEPESLNWVDYVEDEAGQEKTQLTPTQIEEIQEVFRERYNQDLSELQFEPAEALVEEKV